MKRYIIAAFLAITLLNGIVLTAPTAHAANLNEELAKIIAQNQNIGRVQELMQLKKAIEQGNSSSLAAELQKAILQKAVDGKLNKLINEKDISKVTQEIARQVIEQKLQSALGNTDFLGAVSALFSKNELLSVPNGSPISGKPQAYQKVINMTATAYGPGILDNGRWKDATYLGGKVRKGVAAVDPRVIPMGSKLWIDGYGEAIAEDQGSAIKGNRIDLAFNDRQTALDYGIKSVNVYILQ